MCPVHSGRSNNVSYWTAERVADLNGQSYVSVTVAAVTMAPTYWTEERVADLNGQSYVSGRSNHGSYWTAERVADLNSQSNAYCSSR